MKYSKYQIIWFIIGLAIVAAMFQFGSFDACGSGSVERGGSISTFYDEQTCGELFDRSYDLFIQRYYRDEAIAQLLTESQFKLSEYGAERVIQYCMDAYGIEMIFEESTR